MSTTAFLLAILVPIALAIAAWVVWPLLRRTARATGDAHDDGSVRAELNAAIVRERRAQLDRELAALPEGSPERDRLILAFSNAALADLAPEARHGGRAGRVTRWAGAGAMAVLLLAGPLFFYQQAGVPGVVDPDFARRVAPATVEELVAELERRLAEDPGQAEGWMLLGRTRLSLGDVPAAVNALERALKLDSDDATLAAQIRVDLADAVAQAHGSRLAGRPWQLIEDALQRDPAHPKALALAGAYQVSQGNPAGALDYWQRLLEQLPPDSGQHRQIAGFINDLQAGRRPGATPPAASAADATGPDAPGPDAAGPVLRGAVTLGPALAGRARPDETVFVVVRSADADGNPVGPPAAAARIRVADLPWSFAFTDQDAMGPMTRLSAQQRVVVIARVSRSGDAAVAAGDLEGQSPVVTPDATGVSVTIDRERP